MPVFVLVLFLQNQSRWKAMSEEALKSVCAPGSTTSLPPLPPLCAPSLDPADASNQLELEMRYLVSEHRKVKPRCWTRYRPLKFGSFRLRLTHLC